MARQLAQQAKKSVEIIYTGLKPGEKMHEVLLGEGESNYRPMHPLVSHVEVPPITHIDALALPSGRDNAKVIDGLSSMSDHMRVRVHEGASL